MSPVSVLAGLRTDRLLPIVVIDDAAAAKRLGRAVRDGGVGTVEVTLRTPAALTAIAELADAADVTVGAGTVVNADQAVRAIDAGARFIVSPGLSPAVVTYCREAGVLALPGICTATELQTAMELGCDHVKFFPADVCGGPPAIKALSGPFPGARFVPTGGITPANLSEYLALGSVLAVGGSWVVARPLIAAADWDQITRLVGQAVDAARREPGDHHR